MCDWISTLAWCRLAISSSPIWYSCSQRGCRALTSCSNAYQSPANNSVHYTVQTDDRHESRLLRHEQWQQCPTLQKVQLPVAHSLAIKQGSAPQFTLWTQLKSTVCKIPYAATLHVVGSITKDIQPANALEKTQCARGFISAESIIYTTWNAFNEEKMMGMRRQLNPSYRTHNRYRKLTNVSRTAHGIMFNLVHLELGNVLNSSL